MVIDEGKLVALLVDRTGKNSKEVKQNLHQLVEEITEAIETGRQFHIDDFGTFGMEEGDLYFEPVRRLKIEINQKYAGMKPIELMAAFKETSAGIPVKEAPGQKVDKKTEPPAEEKQQIPKKKVEAKSKQAKKPKKHKKKDTPSVAKAKDKTKPKKDTAKRKKQVSSTTDKKKGDSIGRVLVAAVILIAVLTGGWFLYNSGVFSSAATGEVGKVSADTTGQQAPAQDSLKELNDTSARDSTSSPKKPAEQISTNEVSKNSSAYGLKGTFDAQAADGYTIVIHSFRLKSTVQDIADSLKQQSYRTVLFEATTNGETRWRLGLGEFETISDAQTAVQSLSSPYKENHFIKRIPKLNP